MTMSATIGLVLLHSMETFVDDGEIDITKVLSALVSASTPSFSLLLAPSISTEYVYPLLVILFVSLRAVNVSPIAAITIKSINPTTILTDPFWLDIFMTEAYRIILRVTILLMLYCVGFNCGAIIIYSSNAYSNAVPLSNAPPPTQIYNSQKRNYRR